MIQPCMYIYIQLVKYVGAMLVLPRCSHSQDHARASRLPIFRACSTHVAHCMWRRMQQNQTDYSVYDIEKILQVTSEKNLSNVRNKYNVELAIKNLGAIIIFQVHHHNFRGKQILITFSKALIKFAIDMLYYHFFWPKTPSRNNKLPQNQVAIKKILFWARIFFKAIPY